MSTYDRRTFLKAAAATTAVLVAPPLGREIPAPDPTFTAPASGWYAGSVTWLDDPAEDLDVVRWSQLPDRFTPVGGDVFVPLPPSVDAPDSSFYAVAGFPVVAVGYNRAGRAVALQHEA